MNKIFDEKLLNRDITVNTVDVLKNKKNIGIYFSKLNCDPCVVFTTKLSDIYNKIKDIDNDLLEIIFVSFDIMDQLFDINYNKMPFLALPYSNFIQNDRIKNMFNINAIPTLLILDSDGNLKIKNGELLMKNDINIIVNKLQ